MPKITAPASMPATPATFENLLKAWRPEPCLIIDHREKVPLAFTTLRSQRGLLATGDYALAGFTSDFVIERKSLADLVKSVTTGRERFFREMERMRAAPFRRLLIVSHPREVEAHNYRSGASPAAVLASVAAIEARFSVPAVWIPEVGDAAAQVERWAKYFFREQTVKLAERMRELKSE